MKLIPFNTTTHINDHYVHALNIKDAQYIMSVDDTWDRLRVEQYVREIMDDRLQRMFAIEVGCKHVGNLKLRFNTTNKCVEYGRLLWVRGKGYGTEALRQGIAYSFHEWPTAWQVANLADYENTASILSNVKAGMKIRGTWKDYFGHGKDGVIVGITRDEWGEP